MSEPLILSAKYDLAMDFAAKVSSEQDCKIMKVIEIISCAVLQYWIECPKEKEDLITDWCFMTWIKNPVFQKYYHGTKAFDKITEDYLKEREQTCEICKKIKPVNGYGECADCYHERINK